MHLTSYPRPQLRRAQWTSLDGPWEFAFDDDLRWREPHAVPHWPHTIMVPYAPECAASGIGDQGFSGGACQVLLQSSSGSDTVITSRKDAFGASERLLHHAEGANREG